MKDAGAEFKIVEAGSDADKLATISSKTERDLGFPDIPSLYELGYKNSVYGMDFIILGPKGMNPAMAEKVNAALGDAVKDKEVIDQLNKLKMPIEHKTLKDSASILKETDEKIGTTAKALGIGK